MSDAVATVLAALVVQAGGVLLWWLSRRKKNVEDSVAWQKQVVKLSAELTRQFGQRLAEKDQQLGAKDSQLAEQAALIRELVTRQGERDD